MAKQPKVPPKPAKFSKPKLVCSLCENEFEQPMLLPCLHTFCRIPCLERIVVSKNGQLHLTCPTCQTVVSLPDTGVAGLQTDLHAENMLKKHKAIKKTEDKCDNCKESTIAHFFCETCSELICGDCTANTHRSHNYHPINEVMSKHKDELVSSLRPVRDMMGTVQETLQAYTTRATDINNQKAIVEADIHRKIDQLHQLLDQRRVDLMIALASSTEQKLNELATQRNRVEKTHKKISGCLEYTTRCLQSGERDEVLKLKTPVLKQIEKITTEFDPDTLQPKTEADLQCFTDDRASQACREFGSVASATGNEENIYDNLDDTNFTLTDNQCYEHISLKSKEPSSQVRQQQPSNSSHQSAALPSATKNLRKSRTIVPNLHSPFGVVMNSKLQMIVIDSGKHRVLIMTSTGEKISSFGKQGSGKGQFKQPCGVAVDNDNCIYVADNNNHRIQKFTPDGKFVAAIGRCGNGKYQFVYPISICFNKTNEHLYVCDQLNHRIQVFTTDLTFVQSIGSRGSGNGNLNHPKSCAFDSSDRLYVADCSNNRVQVFTIEGEFVRAFPYDGTLQSPFAVAIDNMQKVYVSELNRDQVKIFQADGKYMHSFGAKGTEEGQFRDIRSICFDGNDTMIISDSLNNRLQLFNL